MHTTVTKISPLSPLLYFLSYPHTPRIHQSQKYSNQLQHFNSFSAGSHFRSEKGVFQRQYYFSADCPIFTPLSIIINDTQHSQIFTSNFPTQYCHLIRCLSAHLRRQRHRHGLAVTTSSKAVSINLPLLSSCCS